MVRGGRTSHEPTLKIGSEGPVHPPRVTQENLDPRSRARQKSLRVLAGQLASGLPAALSKVDLISLGGKNEVLNTLAWFRDSEDNPADLFGLVDRDEWDGATIASQIQDLPQLRINPNRHSLESYFCDPREMRPASRVSCRGLIAGGWILWSSR